MGNAPALNTGAPAAAGGRPWISPRMLRAVLGAALALALAWAAWAGYQHPDFLLDLAAFRLC